MIYLVDPPYPHGRTAVSGHKWRAPHIGLAYLSAYLTRQGRSNRVFDLKAVSMEAFLDQMAAERPLLVGVSMFAEEYPAVRRLLAGIKRRRPATRTVLGGPHATALPGQTLADMPDLDFLVYGEGEITLTALVSALAGGENPTGRADAATLPDAPRLDIPGLKAILGLAWRNGPNVVVNPPRPPIMDLDALPFPAWDAFDLSLYNAYFPGKAVELPVLAQRGCPYQCVFCAKPLGSLPRRRSPENLMAEIRRLHRRFGVTRLAMCDETFTLHREYAVTICQALIREGLHRRISWICQTRVDRVDADLLRLMRAAGCRMALFGVESGNDEILRLIRKGTTVTQATRAIAMAKEAGLRTQANLILGFPFETMASLKDTIRFALKTRPDIAIFALLTPYPGTTVHEWAKQNIGGLILLSDNWDEYNKLIGHCLGLRQIPHRRLHLLQLYAYARFFFHPRAIVTLLRIINVRSLPRFLAEKIREMLRG